MAGGVNTKLNEVTAAIEGLQTELHTQTESIIALLSTISDNTIDLSSLISATNTALADLLDRFGAAEAGPSGTLLGILQDVRTNTTTGCNSNPPEVDDPDGCVEPFVSTTQVTSSDYDNRTFAIFPTIMPDGLTEGDFLDPSVAGNAEITHTESGIWKVYVLSCSSSTFSINPTSPVLLPTNRWVDVSIYPDMAFSVPSGGDIVVYICVPSDAGFFDCVQIDSVPARYFSNVDDEEVFSLNLQAATFETVPGLGCANSQMYDTNVEEGYDVDCGVLTGTLNGVTVRLVSGDTPVVVIWISDTGSRSFSNLGIVDDVVTLTGEARSMIVCNPAVSSPSTHPFTIEVCPPEPA
jgi:hypothetical protein